MLGSVTMGSNITKLFIREDWDQMMKILILSNLSKKLFVSRQKILRKRYLSRFHRQSQCPNSWIDQVSLMLTSLIFPLKRYQPLTVWLSFLHEAWWLFSRILSQSLECLWNCRFLLQRAFLVREFLTQFVSITDARAAVVGFSLSCSFMSSQEAIYETRDWICRTV